MTSPSPFMEATSCYRTSKRSSADILSKPLHQQPNVHDSRVRSNSLRHHFDVYQCDDTIFSSRFEPEDYMRTFSQSEPTRLQHRRHRIQGPYHQYPQVPTVSLVFCPTLLKTVPTHFTHDGTQRGPWATKTASPRPLAKRNLPLTFFRENLPDCTSRATSRPSVVLAPIRLCMLSTSAPFYAFKTGVPACMSCLQIAAKRFANLSSLL